MVTVDSRVAVPPMSDRTSGGFGAVLREARERKGLSLQQIATATKIAPGTLEALECDDISKLPGGIFSRAFVRSYAMQVGLDPEATVRDFLAHFPNDSLTVGHPTAGTIEDNEALQSDQRIARTLLRLVVVSLPLVTVLVYFGGSRELPSEQPSAAATPVRATGEQEALSGVLPGGEGASPTAGSLNGPDAPGAPRDTTPDRLNVRLSTSDLCWISVVADSQPPVERLLQAGQQEVVDARQSMVLRAGNAGALNWTINGAAARSLGGSGQVVTVRLDRENFRNFLALP
jgi:cytoskeleton protein RodZ